MARRADCRWLGHTFKAELIKERPDGSFEMLALTAGPRFPAGHRITVLPHELVAWLPDEATPAGKLDTMLSSAIAQFSQPQRAPAMSATPKLDSLLDGFGLFAVTVEEAAGRLHERMARAAGKTVDAVDKFSGAVDKVEATAHAIDDAANRLTNGGPPLAGSDGQPQG